MKRIAIITGASSGIGRQFALTVESQFALDEVWLVARNQERLNEVASQLNCARTFSYDLSEQESFDEFKKVLQEEQPDVAVLVNASGFGVFESFENTPEKDINGMIDVNCKALVRMTRTVLPYMHADASVVQIASMAALQPVPYINVYGATKAFVLSFSRALNRELRERGVHSLAVCPYWTKTRFFEKAITEDNPSVVKRYVVMYEPEDIVTQAWKDLKKKKDVSIYGAIARSQALLCKILPHKVIMDLWQKQQEL